MSRELSLRAAALALCLWAAHPGALAQANAPQLRHTTAPFIGHVLSLEVDGAVPNSPIDLYFSPDSGSTSTPFGWLELRRDGLLKIASGVTTAQGGWSFDLSVPLDESWAETGAHFQALVGDPSVPAGRIFSSAVHARFLGPRVYAGTTRGLDVYGAVDDGVVTRVGYAAGVFGKPVFGATFSRGAVLSTARELLFFDPFFGGVRGTMSFASDCASTLFTDSAHATVFVLEMSSPARVHAVDLLTGAETSHLDLPNPVAGLWVEGSPGVEIFLGEQDPAGRTAIRRIAMEPLADLGSGIVGDPNATASSFDGMVYAGGQVFSATHVPDPFYWRIGSWNRSRVAGSTIATRTIRLGEWYVYLLAAVPGGDAALLGIQYSIGPGSGIMRAPISTVAAPTWIPNGPAPYYRFVEADGDAAWTVTYHEGVYGLWRFDLPSNAWTYYWSCLYGSTASATALLRDAVDHELWLATRSSAQDGIRARITVQDELRGTSRRIPLEHDVESLLAVGVP